MMFAAMVAGSQLKALERAKMTPEELAADDAALANEKVRLWNRLGMDEFIMMAVCVVPPALLIGSVIFCAVKVAMKMKGMDFP